MSKKQGSEFEGSPDTGQKSGQSGQKKKKNPEKSVQIISTIYSQIHSKYS